MTDDILQIDGVSKRFTKGLDIAERTANRLGAKIRPVTVHAVDNVSLTIRRGEILGLVGESGCGKSTLGRMVAGLNPPTEGRIMYRGQDVAGLTGAPAREAALKIQMIFQDPMSSLNPRARVRDIVGEAPRVHGMSWPCEGSSLPAARAPPEAAIRAMPPSSCRLLRRSRECSAAIITPACAT